MDSGERIPFDLLIAVPAHRSPQVVRDSGLMNEVGWIPVVPDTLTTNFAGVYALGDVTVIPLPGRFKPDAPLLPKVGVFAHAPAVTLRPPARR